MHRKGTEGMAIESIAKMILYLLILLASIGIIYIILSGKGAEFVAEAREAISGISPCEKIESGTYEDLMKGIDEVYKDCADNDKCGTMYCKEETMTIPQCYKVTRPSMDSFGMGYLSYLPVCVWASDKFNLLCGGEEDTYNNNGNSDIAYYGKTGDDYCKLGGAFGCFSPVGEYFSIGKGSKVTVSAIKTGLVFKEVDLKIKVTEGDFSSCADAPKKLECSDDTECTVNSHGYCKSGGICEYRRYCSYLCETKNPSCPTTGPDGEKCRMVEADCILKGSCTATSGSLTRTCPDGTKTTITGLDTRYDEKAVMLTTDPGLSPSSLDFIYAGNSRYYRRVSLPWDRMEEQFYPEANDEIRISLEIKTIDDSNKIKAYFGCY